MWWRILCRRSMHLCEGVRHSQIKVDVISRMCVIGELRVKHWKAFLAITRHLVFSLGKPSIAQHLLTAPAAIWAHGVPEDPHRPQTHTHTHAYVAQHSSCSSAVSWRYLSSLTKIGAQIHLRMCALLIYQVILYEGGTTVISGALVSKTFATAGCCTRVWAMNNRKKAIFWPGVIGCHLPKSSLEAWIKINRL